MNTQALNHWYDTVYLGTPDIEVEKEEICVVEADVKTGLNIDHLNRSQTMFHNSDALNDSTLAIMRAISEGSKEVTIQITDDLINFYHQYLQEISCNE